MDGGVVVYEVFWKLQSLGSRKSGEGKFAETCQPCLETTFILHRISAFLNTEASCETPALDVRIWYHHCSDSRSSTCRQDLLLTSKTPCDFPAQAPWSAADKSQCISCHDPIYLAQTNRNPGPSSL